MIEKIEYSSFELANQLSQLEFEVFNTCWQPEVIQEKVNNKEFIYWIYKSNVEIVAYLAVQRIDTELHIIGIGVKEEHRNKQIATKLMDTLLQFLTPTAAPTRSLPNSSLHALGKFIFFSISLNVISPTSFWCSSTMGSFSTLCV